MAEHTAHLLRFLLQRYNNTNKWLHAVSARWTPNDAEGGVQCDLAGASSTAASTGSGSAACWLATAAANVFSGSVKTSEGKPPSPPYPPSM